ncbi:MAG: hypothetical protein RQ756_03530 [Flavobacteriaceae bacterium]|nr:hypothetical protein [Flavobacteriaceae bacterium]
MKNHKFRITKLLLSMLILFFIACEKDDVFRDSTTAIFSNTEQDVVFDKFYVVSKNDKNLQKHLSSNFYISKSNGLLYSEKYDIYIDTTQVLLITTDLYKSFTFKVYDPLIENDTLINYMYTSYRDTLIQQLVFRYPLTTIDDQIEVDIINTKTSMIFDQNLLTKTFPDCGDNEMAFVEYESVCVDYPCGSGDHSGASQADQCNLSGDNLPFTVCHLEPVIICRQTGSGAEVGDIISNPRIVPLGGGTPGEGSFTFGSTKPINDVQLINHNKECQKIKDVFEQDSLHHSGAFKARLQQIATATELNKDFEQGVLAYSDPSLSPLNVQGPPNKDKIDIPFNTSNPISAIAHNHVDSNAGSISIFSLDDLQQANTLFTVGAADPDNFVMFLPTHKGTFYAMTVTNSTGIQEFFRTLSNDFTGLSFEQIQAQLDKRAELKGIKDKYFDDKNKIHHTNTDNEKVLKQFLEFLKEVNLNFQMYETDASFVDFTPLKLNPFGVVERLSDKKC